MPSRTTTRRVRSIRLFVLLSQQSLLPIILRRILFLLRERQWHRPSTDPSMQLCPLIQRLVLRRLNRVPHCILIPHRESIRRHRWSLSSALGVSGDIAVDTGHRPSEDCHFADGLHELRVLWSVGRCGVRLECF